MEMVPQKVAQADATVDHHTWAYDQLSSVDAQINRGTIFAETKNIPVHLALRSLKEALPGTKLHFDKFQTLPFSPYDTLLLVHEAETIQTERHAYDEFCLNKSLGLAAFKSSVLSCRVSVYFLATAPSVSATSFSSGLLGARICYNQLFAHQTRLQV